MSVITGGNREPGAEPRLFVNAGAPTNGAAGTGAGECFPGELLVDQTNGDVYTNRNTKASPTWAKLLPAGAGYADGGAVAPLADAATVAGIMLVHRIDVADAATGNVDVTLTYKERVIDAWLVKTGGAGGASDTIQVKNGATAVSDAMSINVAQKAVVRAATIDDAAWEIAAGGTLRVTRTKASANNVACTVFIRTIRVP